MSRLSRRHFLQFAGSTLAALGLNQLSIPQQANRYGKVLAKSTPRKLALLVGINNYSSQPLQGCVNDVELQRHLLIYRFGFNPKDIYTLTDEQATRQGILDAFEEYLIKQAKPGDVVVYHYSGHGSRVLDPDPIAFESGSRNQLNGTFVPVDSALPDGYPNQGGVVEDIMGHTLFLLMSALPTENFTAILDSCFSGAATRKFRVRARDGGSNIQISPLEKDYQEKWLSRLGWSREEFVRRYQEGVAKGVVIASTNLDQFAADARLNGFYAGAFTYLLTQYLWRQDSTPERTIASVIPQIPQEFNQTPRFEVKVGSGYERQPLYFINTPSPVADVVVTEVKGNRAKVWLGGVDLGTVDRGTVFGVMEGSGRVTLRSRDGLMGEGIVEGGVKEGMLLRERI
ncbi:MULTISPECIES: caspase family protein [unclassified Coleofasciculus]|uniref:caspase family protein n=1 Tax=unclassified Coleofasciculus TaxID=2692782 RepID=UPI001880A04B|nr:MULTISPECIES: caspase family protein [unclassified Coleofasciculus]MBE9129320.1 caspase family protein [Coleofasciculus sp. LEGE 07081]MBE9151994.1 caspase family protein [Coleofasciculus sp. LEGE 07092]